MIAPPILRSSPLRVVGMPVALEISRFNLEMPNARRQEKLSPRIFMVLFVEIGIVRIEGGDEIGKVKASVKIFSAAHFFVKHFFCAFFVGIKCQTVVDGH